MCLKHLRESSTRLQKHRALGPSSLPGTKSQREKRRKIPKMHLLVFTSKSCGACLSFFGADMILGRGGTFPFTEEGMRELLGMVQGVTIATLDGGRKTASSASSPQTPSLVVFRFALVDGQVFQVEGSSGKILYPPQSERRIQVPAIVDPAEFFKNVPMFPCWMMIHEGRVIGMMNATLRGEDERASIDMRLRETPLSFVTRMVASSGSSQQRPESKTAPKPFVFITD